MGTLLIALSSLLGVSIGVSVCGISWGFGVGASGISRVFGVGEDTTRLVVLIPTVEEAEVTGLDDGVIDRGSVCV